MSLARWIYWGALICGWAAFLGWLVSEILVQNSVQNTTVQTSLTTGLVGAALGAGLGLLMALNGFTWQRFGTRVMVGLGGGLLLGVLCGLLAQLLYQTTGGRFRFVGWTLLGLGIGAITGLLDRSLPRLRNGLIGGALGGLLGGLLFEPIRNISEGMTPRAVGFTILGLCIGAFVGIVQVFMREAWLTVMDGYRVGRQLILTQPITVLGRAEHLPLPFIGSSNSTLEKEHVRIVRQPDGRYFVEDNQTAAGTRLNQQPLTTSVPLRNDDVIRLGSNLVRFNEKTKQRHDHADPNQPQGDMNAAPAPSQPANAVSARPLPPPPARAKAPAPPVSTPSAPAPAPQGPKAPPPPPPAPAGKKAPAPPAPSGTRPLPTPPALPGSKPLPPPPPGPRPAPPPQPQQGATPAAPKPKPLPPPPGGKSPPPPPPPRK